MKNGTYPAKLYVDYNDVPNTYGTIYDMTLKEWQKLKRPHINANLRQLYCFERAKTELTAKGEQDSIDVFISDDLRDKAN